VNYRGSGPISKRVENAFTDFWNFFMKCECWMIKRTKLTYVSVSVNDGQLDCIFVHNITTVIVEMRFMSILLVSDNKNII